MKNFTLKALVAAVALAGAVGNANADIRSNLTTVGATGSEIVFYVTDSVSKNSFVLDLGSSFANVIANPATYASGFTAVNIAGDANWATFLANETSGLGNAKWGVFASAATNATLQVANGVQILTTASGNATSATTNSQLRGIVGAFGTTYLGGLQGAGTNFAVNDSYFATGGTNSGNWASGLADNLANKVAFNTDNAIGSTADFFRLTEPASGTNATISTLFSGATQWSFDGNTLSITGQTAPIPEPGTWAMLLAGLMMVGGIARRRMSI